MRSDNIPINEPMFKEKAHKFPEQLNLEDFHASNGWLKKLEKGYTDLRLSNFLLNSLQQRTRLNDKDDPFAALDEIEEDTVQILEASLAVLKEKLGDQIDADTTSDDYIDFDIEVITSHGKLTNQEILAEINDDVNEESDGEEEDPNDFEPINKPGIEDAREALQVLEDFSLFSKFGESMLKSLKELNRSLDREELSHKKQSVITSFFSKQQI